MNSCHESVSGIILKRLVMDAQDRHGARSTSLQAVITVPAYFRWLRKEANTWPLSREVDCLELAEPVAAVYAYGVEKAGNGGPLSLIWERDLTLLLAGMADRRRRIWAVDGETRLGDDWDQRMFVC